MQLGCQCPFVLLLHPQGYIRRGAGHRDLSSVDGEFGVFRNVARHMRLPLEFQCETGLLLRWDVKVGIPFQTKQGNQSSCRDQEGRMGSD